jgi:hypothetical protein
MTNGKEKKETSIYIYIFFNAGALEGNKWHHLNQKKRNTKQNWK